MINWYRRLLICVLLLALLLPAWAGHAQDTPDKGPVYIVQKGDTLWSIALRFRVGITDLENANGITNPNQLTLGMRLVIPGLTGVQGVLDTTTLGYGETLHSLSLRYRVSEANLVKLNHLTSPTELFAGASLIIPQVASGQGVTATAATSGTMAGVRRLALAPGQSLLELAAEQGVNPWAVVTASAITSTAQALPGELLAIPGAGASGVLSGLPDAITSVKLNPLPLVQGKAVVMQIAGLPGLKLQGTLNGRTFNFFQEKEGSYVGLQGIHAMADPGMYTLVLSGTLPAEAPYFGAPFAFAQSVFVKDGGYPFDPALTVSPETVDPAVTKPEDAEWTALAAPLTDQQLWKGQFKFPVPAIYKDCFPSIFGSRRSFNGSAYTYFHTGLDFCGGTGTKIFAPADGVVVFAGPLTVRGNATMINHGWGVYTGYMHQSKIEVKVGDKVEAGQEIGLIGGTGRVTGPHLHFEIWVGGVQVDPQDWLKEIFP